MTALEMKVFTYSNITYGSWKSMSFPMGTECKQIFILHMNLNSWQFIHIKRKKEKRNSLTSLAKLVQVSSTAIFTSITCICKINATYAFLHPQTPSIQNSFLGEGRYNALLLCQQISFRQTLLKFHIVYRRKVTEVLVNFKSFPLIASTLFYIQSVLKSPF